MHNAPGVDSGRVTAYLKSERQWPHALRVTRAKFEFDRSEQADKAFWRAVLHRLDKRSIRVVVNFNTPHAQAA